MCGIRSAAIFHPISRPFGLRYAKKLRISLARQFDTRPAAKSTYRTLIVEDKQRSAAMQKQAQMA